MPAGVGVDFRAVEPDRSHSQNAHLARQQQHLNEHPLDLLEKPPPERRNRVMVGMIVSRKKQNATESYVARSSLRLENTPVA